MDPDELHQYLPQQWEGTNNTIQYMPQNIDGLVQEWRNSSALAMELLLSCTDPWICSWLCCLLFYLFNLYQITPLMVTIFLRVVLLALPCCSNPEGYGYDRLSPNQTGKQQSIKCVPPARNELYIWGLWCQKQVSMVWISNYIPQHSVGCNYISMSYKPGITLLKYNHKLHFYLRLTHFGLV